MEEFIVDIQGFQNSNSGLIVKELAIFPIQDSTLPLVFTFKPPTQWDELSIDEKCTARWLEKNYHRIRWSQGDIPYQQMNNVLHKYLSNAKKIYVKGEEKKIFLQKLLSYKT